MALIFDSNVFSAGELIFDTNTYVSGSFVGLAVRTVLRPYGRASTGPFGISFNETAVKSLYNPTSRSSGGLFDSTFTGIAVKSQLRVNPNWPGFVQSPTGITENDTWVEPINIELVRDVSVGVLELYVDGSFSYTSPPNFSGDISFDYRLWEQGQPSNVGTVTITVTGGFIGVASSAKLPHPGKAATINHGHNLDAVKTHTSLISRAAASTLGEAFIDSANKRILGVTSGVSVLEFGTGFSGTAKRSVLSHRSQAGTVTYGQAPIAVTSQHGIQGSITNLLYGNNYLAVTGQAQVQGHTSLFPYPALYFLKSTGKVRSFNTTGHITKL